MACATSTAVESSSLQTGTSSTSPTLCAGSESDCTVSRPASCCVSTSRGYIQLNYLYLSTLVDDWKFAARVGSCNHTRSSVSNGRARSSQQNLELQRAR